MWTGEHCHRNGNAQLALNAYSLAHRPEARRCAKQSHHEDYEQWKRWGLSQIWVLRRDSPRQTTPVDHPRPRVVGTWPPNGETISIG